MREFKHQRVGAYVENGYGTFITTKGVPVRQMISLDFG
jgi:hypothetical protein